MRDSYSFYKDRLEDEYKKAFEQVEAYSMVLNIAKDKWEEQMMDLIDVFLTAQSEGKPVHKIVGSDIAKFCEKFCQRFTLWDYVRSFIDTVKRCTWIVLVCTVLEVIAMWGEKSFWQQKTDIGCFWIGMLSGIAISYISEFAVRKWMHHFKKFSMRNFNVMLVINVVACICTVSLMLLFDEVELACWMVITFSVTYLALYYFFTRTGRRRIEKVRFTDKVAEGMPKELMRQFENENKKMAKKSEHPQTEMEYIDKVIDRCEKYRRQSKWIPAMIILMICGCAFLTWCLEGFESIGELLIFVAITLGSACMVGVPIFRFTSRMNTVQLEWAVEAKERGGFLREGESSTLDEDRDITAEMEE